MNKPMNPVQAPMQPETVFLTESSLSLEPPDLQVGNFRESPFELPVMSWGRKFINVMDALMTAVFMGIMILVYLLVLEDKDDYESRSRSSDQTDYLGSDK